MYVVAFWSAWFFLPRLGKMRGMGIPVDQWTRIVAWGALGVLAGGRIGYALFYEPWFFFQSPIELFSIWNGGMSSHGGFVGAALGVWWAMRNFSPSYEGEPACPAGRREGVSVRAIADVLAVPVALGLALGRVGNMINQEFGNYPYYEAVGDVLIAVVCYLLLKYSRRVPFSPIGEKVQPAFVRDADEGSLSGMTSPHPPAFGRGALSPIGERGASRGTTFALFLLLYSILRFSLEYIRPQDFSLLFGLSRGQLLTIPLFVLAVILLNNARQKRI